MLLKYKNKYTLNTEAWPNNVGSQPYINDKDSNFFLFENKKYFQINLHITYQFKSNSLFKIS
jgi:hypothetical protein